MHECKNQSRVSDVAGCLVNRLSVPKGNEDNNMALAGNTDPVVATDTLYRSPDNNDCNRYKILATKLTFYQKKC